MLIFILLSAVSFAPVPKTCDSWCEDHKDDWDTKCNWMECASCTSCPVKEPQCEPWCLTHPAEFVQKCGWIGCAGCDPQCEHITGDELFCPLWCEGHSMDWEQKCNWAGCIHCDACTAPDENVYGYWYHTRTYKLASGNPDKIFTTGPVCGRQSDTFEVSTFAGKHCTSIDKGETIHVVNQDGDRVSQGYYCEDQVTELPELESTFTADVACQVPVTYGYWTITRTYQWGNVYTTKPKCGSSADTFHNDATPCPHCDEMERGQCMIVKNQNDITMAGGYFCTEQVSEGWPVITAEFEESADCDYGHYTITRVYDHTEKVSESFCGHKEDSFVVGTVPCKVCTENDTGECYIVNDQDGKFTGVGGFCTGVTDYPELKVQFDSSPNCSPKEQMSSSKCPGGYVEGFDVPGWGKVEGRGGGEVVVNCEECQTLCDQYEKCLGYECSPSTLECKLNDEVSTGDNLHKDFVVCNKETESAKQFLELFSAISLDDNNYSQIAICGFALIGAFTIARQAISRWKGDSYESVNETEV